MKIKDKKLDDLVAKLADLQTKKAEFETSRQAAQAEANRLKDSIGGDILQGGDVSSAGKKIEAINGKLAALTSAIRAANKSMAETEAGIKQTKTAWSEKRQAEIGKITDDLTLQAARDLVEIIKRFVKASELIDEAMQIRTSYQVRGHLSAGIDMLAISGGMAGIVSMLAEINPAIIPLIAEIEKETNIWRL